MRPFAGSPRRSRGSAALAAALMVLGLLVAVPAPAGADDRAELAAVATVNRRSVTEVERILSDPAAKVDADKRIFFVDADPAGDTAGEAPLAAAHPYDSTFRLHSRPGSARVIYLDFDGHTIASTKWNSYFGQASITAEPFSMDGSAAFSVAEQDVVQEVWQRVAEDFAVFDVDVTTEDPGEAAITRSDEADLRFGTRALVTDSATLAGSCGCLGVAYFGAFADPSTHAAHQPALVMSRPLGNVAKAVADAASHEVGHNLGLYHDGVGSTEYYQGHGTWAPLMGLPIYRPITQWSRGEYSGATNGQDDVATIAAMGAPLLGDDHGGAIAAATPLAGRATVTGVISSDADVDAFSFRVGGGGATISVDPAPGGPNLDVLLELRTANGALVASDDPPAATVSEGRASGLGASVATTLLPGDYVALVSGTGTGTPSTGYSGYGSIGRYTLTARLDQPAVALTSSANPSILGRPVTLTATVSPASPGALTGTVTFLEGTAPFCRDVPLSGGKATCTWSPTAGRHGVRAAYSGNATFSEASSATLEQVVDGDDVTVTVTSSPNPSVADQKVAVTTTVAPKAPVTEVPTGTVTIRQGDSVVCADVPLAAGRATCGHVLAAGSHPFTASYSGNARFDATLSPAMTQVVGRATPHLAIESHQAPVTPNMAVVLSAAVWGQSGVVKPTGTVDFLQGTTVVCSARPLYDGQASCFFGLPPGSYGITAVYNGDGNFTAAQSPVFTQVVIQYPTGIEVRIQPGISAAGETVRITADLTPHRSDWTGLVRFASGETTLCAGVPVVANQAACSTPLPHGHHEITATYSGDGTHGPRTSVPIIHVVGLAAAQVAVTPSTSTPVPGTPVTLRGSVAAAVPANGTPTGGLTFRDGDVVLCDRVPLVDGQASCAAVFAAGHHPVSAHYSGNAAFSQAVSPTVDLVADGEAATVSLTSSDAITVVGQPTTLRATVAASGGGAPTGTLTFWASTPWGAPFPLCRDVPIAGGGATCTSPVPYSFSTWPEQILFAGYSGDGHFRPAMSSNVKHLVKPASSTIVAAPPPGPVRAGTAVSLSASVSINAPGAGPLDGLVSFQAGAHGCSALVSAGVARCWAYLPEGVHRIRASYGGTVMAGVSGSYAEPFEVTVLPAGDGLVPVTPARLLDTRVGIGGPALSVGPGAVRDVVVRGGATGIPESATAVVVNTTATGATAGSYLTVWPAGTQQPGTSNLNFSKGQTIPNLVVVGVGAGGRISIANQSGSVHVLVDVVGYYTAGGGGRFTPMTPTRLLDTRIGTGGPAAAVGPGGTRELVVRGGATGIPADATAVVLNVTATGPTATSYLTVHPSGVARPHASNLNFVPGQTVPNQVVVGVGAGDRISIFNALGSVQVLADVVGYYAPATGSTFTPVTPARAYDSRLVSLAGLPVAGGTTRDVPVVGGEAGVPAHAKAVILNVTVAHATDPGYLTVYPAGVARPLASSLNFVQGQIVPNLVTVGVGDGGSISVFNAAGNVHVVVDVVGYMS